MATSIPRARSARGGLLIGSRQVSDASKATSKVKAPTFAGTSFRAEMDKKYRQRSLHNQLRSVPLFAFVEEDFLAYLEEKVELVSYNQNQLICTEGEEADAFYLIRFGMVRVSQSMPGGELVFVGADVGESESYVVRILRALWGAGALTIVLGLIEPDRMRPVRIRPRKLSASSVVTSMRNAGSGSILGAGTCLITRSNSGSRVGC